MRIAQALIAMACFTFALAQSPKPTAKQPHWLETRWRARIAQDLARKGIVRSPNDPLVADLTPLLADLKPVFPEAKISTRFPLDGPGKPSRILDLQIQTLLDETVNTRFVRAVNIRIRRELDAGAAQERLVYALMTPAIYQGGPIQGAEPGQLCYHTNDATQASEIFLRENMVVAIHCSGPKSVAKRRYRITERTSVPGSCPEIVPPLGLQIDRLLQNRLGRR